MAIVKGQVIHLEGHTFAFPRNDGSLAIMTGYTVNGKDCNYDDAVELSPEGVKKLNALLVRDAQLRIGADDAGHSEACSASTHEFLREKAGHPFCYKCGERLHS